VQPDQYHRFTESLRQQLEADARVIGLAALGSMAERDYAPDAFSDHDFFVITQPGRQEEFRSDLSWLPDFTRIALSYRETAHGLKVLYRDPHLLEFAIFDREELHLARINRYRLLIDKEGLAAEFATVKEKSDASTRHEVDDAFHLGQVLTILYVGLGRYRRGERLSGHVFVRTSVLHHLVPLLAKHLPTERRALLDNLDSFRRFDFVFPEVAAELQHTLAHPVPEAALGLLDLAEKHLKRRVGGTWPGEAVAVVRAFAQEGLEQAGA